MSFLAVLKVYLLASLVCFGLDMLWLGVVARAFYQKQLVHILRPDIQWGPAVAFYLLFVVGVMVFAVVPALERGSLGRAVWSGAFLGLVAYATYDLTNLALAKDFPPIVAVVDMAWGTAIAAVVAAAGYGFGRWITTS